jgi:hypothetical protein
MHIVQQPGEQMRGQGVYIIIIVGRIVSLQAVSHLDEDYIVFSVGLAHAVHIGIDRKERTPYIVSNVGGVKPGSVDVVGAEHGKGILSVLEAMAAGKGKKHCAQKQKGAGFHIISYYVS